MKDLYLKMDSSLQNSNIEIMKQNKMLADALLEFKESRNQFRQASELADEGSIRK